jgi:uncharacterized membrane protein YraQ (UPF0718 family)
VITKRRQITNLRRKEGAIMNNLKQYYLTAILTGYSCWFLFLLTTDTLKIYINPRLSFLSVLTFIFLVAMLLNNLRQTNLHRFNPHVCESSHHVSAHTHDCECSHHHEKWEKSSLLLLLPLLLPLLVPPHALCYRIDTPELTTMLPRMVTVFLSIIIQALPFVLLGVFGSAAMHNLVTAEMVETKLARTAKLPGILLAIGAGFCFPVCDCGVIPVARRLLIKKVPPYMAIAFLVTAPLINPITIWATATAFGYNLTVTVTRVALAIGVGISVALVVSKLFPSLEQIFNQKTLRQLEEAAGSTLAQTTGQERQGSILSAIFNHANEEFLEVGKFLIIGSLIAATIQTFIFNQVLLGITQNPMLSVLVMMALAVCLSLCAEADAFVARSFVAHFSMGSIMSFMVFGQMFDLKNLALLLKNFKLKALLIIFGLCAILVFGFCSLINLCPGNAILNWRSQ